MPNQATPQTNPHRKYQNWIVVIEKPSGDARSIQRTVRATDPDDAITCVQDSHFFPASGDVIKRVIKT
ncbi:hypothetical protein [Roseiconus lacunae]|uniref:hypothetical protein n=1 Tax=Roseiconus lacunae TaxID=2605694 RepID=UPI0011F3A2DA|nr:hypothetical protein [Roseiconus lacunae]